LLNQGENHNHYFSFIGLEGEAQGLATIFVHPSTTLKIHMGGISNGHHFSSVVRPSTFHILIFSSETTGPIATKLWWYGPWMACLCPVIPTSNQDGHQAKNRKKGG
jgi:hypothetical protein